MSRPVKSINQMSRKISKAERQAREETEKQFVKLSELKPEPWFLKNKEEIKIFNFLVKLNDLFTESDSTSLCILSKSLYQYRALNTVLDKLEVNDDRSVSIEKRILAYEKSIIQHMNLLCIPLSQRLRLSNDWAKLKIEEKKLQQIEEANKPKPINPLLALLKDDEDE